MHIKREVKQTDDERKRKREIQVMKISIKGKKG